MREPSGTSPQKSLAEPFRDVQALHGFDVADAVLPPRFQKRRQIKGGAFTASLVSGFTTTARYRKLPESAFSIQVCRYRRLPKSAFGIQVCRCRGGWSTSPPRSAER